MTIRGFRINFDTLYGADARTSIPETEAAPMAPL